MVKTPNEGWGQMAAVSRVDGVRVVVTGHDPDGIGSVASDEMVGPYEQRAAGYKFHLLWGADELPTYPDDGCQASFTTPLPPVGGLRFAMLVVEPEDSAVEPGSADSTAMAGLKAGDSQIHATATVDLLVVLEGEVWLELDEAKDVHLRAGDCVVQQGTRHAWRNHGTTEARVAVAVIGVEHAGIPAAR